MPSIDTTAARRHPSASAAATQPGRGAAIISSTTAIEPVDPVAVFERFAGEERALWFQPATGFAMAAVGAVARLTAGGSARFAEIETARRRLLADVAVEQPGDFPITAPVVIGGFAFDAERTHGPEWRGFPDALLVLPKLLFTRQDDSCWLTTNSLAGPNGAPNLDAADAHGQFAGEAGDHSCGAESSEDAWKESVAQAVSRIRAGDLDKLVLARRARLGLPAGAGVAEALRRLVEGYPHCTVFAYARGDACFLGATPERLIRVTRQTGGDLHAPGQISADCLAGSAPRGATPDEDLRLGTALLADEKERYEHAVVVQSMHDDLEPLCSHLDVPESPRLLRMPNVQHLHTPIQGSLGAEHGVLDLVERLHPTPAAGGLPRDRALALIRGSEAFDRGWYAGPVGWVDGRGDGEFAVAIRSGLVRGQEAFLYAGCGIVSGSDPDREYNESSIKMRPLQWALGNRTA